MILAIVLLGTLQAGAATLTGRIVDGTSGAPIPGAFVLMADLGRGVATDDDGRYVIRDVPAGPQHVEVRSVGYRSRTVHALMPRVGTLELDVRLTSVPIELAPFAVHATVPVRDVGPPVEDRHPADRQVTRAQMYHHPQVSEADPLDALRGGGVTIAAENPTGVHLRGGAADQTAFAIDGIPVFNPYHSATLFSAWNPDALARVDVRAAAPPAGSESSLSGVVQAVTRPAGSVPSGEGSVSTTQSRITAHGPIADGASWLVSARTGYPDVLSPREQSYIRGSSADGLGRVELPAARGRLRFLAYLHDDHVDAAADSRVPDSPRNAFDWTGLSVGASWSRPLPGGSTLELRAWNARATADAIWDAASVAPVRLATERDDLGAVLQVEVPSAGRVVTAGLRFDHIRTAYRVRGDSLSLGGNSIAAVTPIAIVFGDWARRFGTMRASAGVALASAEGAVHTSPRATIEWAVRDDISLYASLAQLHQFVHSLRNSESVVGHVFPAELHVAAERGVMPVGRSRNAVAGVDIRAGAGVRVGVQGWLRRFDHILLVAPVDGQPFAASDFVGGSGRASGIAADLGVSARRFGVTASWLWQSVRLRHGDIAYVPEHGSSHVLDAGFIVFPATTLSLRLGAAATFGRRGALFDGFEWESCNLLDEGCEFGGTPDHSGSEPGTLALPGYARVDFGVRKHWHVQVGSRDATLALFGTISNLFGRRNVLARVIDEETGERRSVTMRPFAPLTVGVDWRF